jgi:hypothetical protein
VHSSAGLVVTNHLITLLINWTCNASLPVTGYLLSIPYFSYQTIQCLREALFSTLPYFRRYSINARVRIIFIALTALSYSSLVGDFTGSSFLAVVTYFRAVSTRFSPDCFGLSSSLKCSAYLHFILFLSPMNITSLSLERFVRASKRSLIVLIFLYVMYGFAELNCSLILRIFSVICFLFFLRQVGYFALLCSAYIILVSFLLLYEPGTGGRSMHHFQLE